MSDTRPDGDAAQTRSTDVRAADVDASPTADAAPSHERAADTAVWTPDRDAESDDAASDYVPGAYSTRLYDEGEVPDAPTRADARAADDGHRAAETRAGADTATRADGLDIATRADRPDTATRAYSPDAETVAVAPVGAPAASAGSDAAAASVTPPAQQPIFVQAPEQPVPRGNRGAAGAIGVLAAIVFAVLYLAVALGLSAVTGQLTAEGIVPGLLSALASWALWVPVAVFFLAFWLLGAIVNRGRWGTWVILGLLVGAAAYAGHIVGALFQAQFWTLTAAQGRAVIDTQLLAPLAVAAFVIGRELTIWFGAWVARRGRRMTELNSEAQREYERTLEAGPKLYAS